MSNDGGASWQEASTGLLPRTGIWDIEIDPVDPSNIFVGTYAEGSDGVFKSVDGGQSWRSVNNADLEDTGVSALALFRKNPQIVFAGTRNQGVFKSTDGGGSWQFLGLRHYIEDLAIHPRNASIVYVSTQGFFRRLRPGIFKSTDGGLHWRPMNVGLALYYSRNSVSVLAIDPRSPAIIYAGTVDGLYKSTNAGRSWRAIGVDGSIVGLAIDPERPKTVVAATALDGVFRSTDGGANWQPFSKGLSSRQREFLQTLATDATGRVLYAGGRHGVVDYRFR